MIGVGGPYRGLIVAIKSQCLDECYGIELGLNILMYNELEFLCLDDLSTYTIAWMTVLWNDCMPLSASETCYYWLTYICWRCGWIYYALIDRLTFGCLNAMVYCLVEWFHGFDPLVFLMDGCFIRRNVGVKCFVWTNGLPAQTGLLFDLTRGGPCQHGLIIAIYVWM